MEEEQHHGSEAAVGSGGGGGEPRADEDDDGSMVRRMKTECENGGRSDVGGKRGGKVSGNDDNRDDDRHRHRRGSAQYAADERVGGGVRFGDDQLHRNRVLSLRRARALRSVHKPLEALLLCQQLDVSGGSNGMGGNKGGGGEYNAAAMKILDLHALIEQGLCFHILQRHAEALQSFNVFLTRYQTVKTELRDPADMTAETDAENRTATSSIPADAGIETTSDEGDSTSSMMSSMCSADRADAPGEESSSNTSQERRSVATTIAVPVAVARANLRCLHAAAIAGLAALKKEDGYLRDAASLLAHACKILSENDNVNNANGNDENEVKNEFTRTRARPEVPMMSSPPSSVSTTVADLEPPLSAAEIRSAYAGILTDLGTSLKADGTASFPDAMNKYTEAIAADETHAPSFYCAGVLFGEMGEQDRAMDMYERAVLVQPLYPEALCNMGVILKSKGDIQQALRCYERCLAAAPNFVLAQRNAAIALCELATQMRSERQFDDAMRMYEKSLSLHPQYAEGYYNFAVALAERGNTDAAIIMYEAAIRYNPSCAEAFNNLGVIYRDRGNLEKAMECYTTAMKLLPSFPQPMNNLGVIYTCQGRFSEALKVLRAAVEAAPWYAEAYNNLGVLYRDAGLINDAINAYENCLRLDPTSRNAGQNRLLALNCIISGEDARVSDAHREWGCAFTERIEMGKIAGGSAASSAGSGGATTPARIAEPRNLTDQPLVIGYISPDLFVHSVSYFIEAPLRHHRASRVKIVIYNVTRSQDRKTQMFRSLAKKKGWAWRDVVNEKEEEIADIVRRDGVDILVELTGHTANNRLGVLVHRAAPIQVTWIGYPNSTGLSQCDYRFTDAIADPADTAQEYVETLYRLPQCFLCYTATSADEAGPVGSLPALHNGYITFGSFNTLAKMTPDVFRLWARVLRAVPNSNLLIKGKSLACPSVVARLQQYFVENGVSPTRIDTMPLMPQTGSHLQVYSTHVDISIDTFPYGGTTTTCESLYMGTPCITLRGNCHAQNVGASLLTAVGLEDWIADTEDEYVEIAKLAASDLNALATLRAQLRDRLLASPLCNGPDFVSALEDVYYELWDAEVNKREEHDDDDDGSQRRGSRDNGTGADS